MLAGLIEAVGPLGDLSAGRPQRDDHYGSLVRAIVGQQLSVKAAASIYGRLTSRFGDRAPTPQEILADEPEELRAAAGLSRAKVGFLRSLAEHVMSGELGARAPRAPVRRGGLAELTAVKGIGRWSADMFLMFHLDRPDVLPVGDLGDPPRNRTGLRSRRAARKRLRWSGSPRPGVRTGRWRAVICGARSRTSRAEPGQPG